MTINAEINTADYIYVIVKFNTCVYLRLSVSICG
jgi:hypothetical protein